MVCNSERGVEIAIALIFSWTLSIREERRFAFSSRKALGCRFEVMYEINVVREVNMVCIDEGLDALCNVSVFSAVMREDSLVRGGEMNLSSSRFASSGNLRSRMPDPSMLGKAASKATVRLPSDVGITFSLTYCQLGRIIVNLH